VSARARHSPGGGRRRRYAAVLALAGFGALASPAAAQEDLLELLDPAIGQLRPRAAYRLTVVPDQPVAGQATELGMLQHDLRLATPLRQDERDEWFAAARVREQVFDTGAVLPDTGEPFPEELWDVRASVGYRHRFDSGWIAAAEVTVGSPSDRPFASFDEVNVGATGVLRVPHGERGAWLFFVDYSRTREIFGGVPLPGVGYAYRPTDALDLVVATGFVSVLYRPTEKLTLRAYYGAVRTVDLRVMYQLFRAVRVWAGFDWTDERYLRADRPDTDDRLFYYEKRFRVGAIIGLARYPQLYVDLAAGYTFDRFYFEGEDYSDRHRNRIDVDSGFFGAVRLGARF
jgi:hypothetical protein